MRSAIVVAAAALALALPAPIPVAGAEVHEYQGTKLDAFERDYDNSIRGPQAVDRAAYRLRVDGLVTAPRELTYDEVLKLPAVKRVITLHCVEGWDETLLFEGARLADVLAAVGGPRPSAREVVFFALDGYSSSLPLDFVRQRDLLLAWRINGRELDSHRGFPFQVVAESKYGYKWVKWVTRIELVDREYQGYWESRGYSNDATVGRKP